MLSICSSQPLLTAEYEKNLFFPVVWLQPKMREKKIYATPTNEKKPKQENLDVI